MSDLSLNCNWTPQIWSVVTLTDLRRPPSLTQSCAAKWARIQCLPVVSMVNWSIKIPPALLQLQSASNKPLCHRDLQGPRTLIHYSHCCFERLLWFLLPQWSRGSERSQWRPLSYPLSKRVSQRDSGRILTLSSFFLKKQSMLWFCHFAN